MKPYGIEIDPKDLRGMGWRDYALRFILGGGVTASAGVIAKIYGPVIGGLFLAFPAIFPASATLIEKHEIKKKAKAGFDGTIRGVKAASIDAAGAAIGTILGDRVKSGHTCDSGLSQLVDSSNFRIADDIGPQNAPFSA